MIRQILFSMLFGAIFACTALSAQINNYFNAPSQFLPPGTASQPGVTPFVGGTPQVLGTPAGPTYSNYYPYPQSYYTTPPGAYPMNPYTVPPSPFPTAGTGNVSSAFNTPLRTTAGLYPTAGVPAYGAQGGVPSYATQQPAPFTPITVPIPGYAVVEPPETWSPGLSTIQNGRWVTTDFLYRLPPSIGIKVVIVRPPNRYLPLSEPILEKRIADIFTEAQLIPSPLVLPCEPPLPMFHISILAYPCGQHCVGVVIAQLYEVARPARIDQDLAGVWQAITWERSELVSSSCEEFAQQVDLSVASIAETFAWQYNHFNPIPVRKCFPGE